MKNELVAWIVGLLTLTAVAVGVAKAEQAVPLNEYWKQSVFMSERTGDLLSSGLHRCTFSKVGPHLFLTAQHCVDSIAPNTLQLSFRDKVVPVTRYFVPAVEADIDPKADIAFMVTDEELPDMKAFDISCSFDPKIGDEVASAGYPANIPYTVVFGTVTAVGQWREEDQRMLVGADWWSDMPSVGGQSGSPVISRSDQKLVGVMVEDVANSYAGIQQIDLNGICW